MFKTQDYVGTFLYFQLHFAMKLQLLTNFKTNFLYPQTS